MSDNHSVLSYFRVEDLLISTTRYYLGRMTAAGGSYAEQLGKAWPFLPCEVRDILRRDIEQKFDDDDRARDLGRTQDGPLPLGMDCDRDMWGMVRSAWQIQDAVDEVHRLQAIEDAALLNRL